MRTEANGPAGRGRPADPGIERRVLAAALTVYGEVGWAGFTLDRVARRAPVGKAALYRRWPTKEDLLLAALEHLAEPPGDEADPADLRGCLIGMTEQVIDMFVGPKALVLPRVLIEASQYPPRFDDMVQNIVRARFGTVRTVIQAAADHRRHHGPGDQPHRAHPRRPASHHQRRTRPLRRVDHRLRAARHRGVRRWSCRSTSVPTAPVR